MFILKLFFFLLNCCSKIFLISENRERLKCYNLEHSTRTYAESHSHEVTHNMIIFVTIMPWEIKLLRRVQHKMSKVLQCTYPQCAPYVRWNFVHISISVAKMINLAIEQVSKSNYNLISFNLTSLETFSSSTLSTATRDNRMQALTFTQLSELNIQKMQLSM